MSAISKTKALRRLDLSLNVLVPNPVNPNKMKPREFDLLCDNISKMGFLDPIIVRSQGDKYRIVGGHHRFEAARYLGFESVPCTIIDDPEFTQEVEEFQLVRHNVIHGSMDPQKFMALYQKYASEYGDDILQEMFGFAEEAEFQKLIKETAKTLPKDMQKKFLEAAKEIKTIDGLAKLLNEMFTRHGDTLPYGYMVLDYGSQKSVWLRVSKKTMDSVDIVGQICVERRRSVDDIVGQVLQLIAKGELSEVVNKAVEDSPEIDLPKNLQVMPTMDNIETIGEL